MTNEERDVLNLRNISGESADYFRRQAAGRDMTHADFFERLISLHTKMQEVADKNPDVAAALTALGLGRLTHSL